MSDENEERQVHAWITKYALTSGVYEVDGFHKDSSPTRMMVVRKGGHSTDFFHNQEWHETEDAARQHVVQMCLRKKKSLEKQLAKIGKILQENLS